MADYDAYLKGLDDEDGGEDRISNVDELISKITDYEENAEEPTLSGFLEEVALVSDIDETQDTQNKVLLMTLHSAKGLEFSHVYISGMEDNVFPSAMALNSNDDEAEAEERRLAYVGITRAKDDLTLTYSMSRMLRGEIQYNPVSRFVYEIPEELMDGDVDSASGGSRLPERDAGLSSAKTGSGQSRTGTGQRPRPKAAFNKPKTNYGGRSVGSSLSSLKKGMSAAPSKPDYKAGDRVKHVKYGTGTVVSIEPGPRDYKVTVIFDQFGQKIMYAAFAKLVKC